MNRFLSLIGCPRSEQPPQLTDNRRLVRVIHGEIGVRPVAQDPEAPELFPLNVDKPGSILTTESPLLDQRYLCLLAAQVFIDLVFDREPVAIPSRDIGGVVAEHRLRLDDDVLQDLIERMTDVNVAIRIGGTVVEDPDLSISSDLAEPSIEIQRFPPLEDG